MSANHVMGMKTSLCVQVNFPSPLEKFLDAQKQKKLKISDSETMSLSF